MSMTAAARLGRPDLAPLVDELARRFADGKPTSVSLRGLDDASLGAIADLLGSATVPDRERRMPIHRLQVALGLASDNELRAAVEALRGPIPDHRSRRASAAAERADLWSWFESAVDALETCGDLGAWAARVRQAGVRGGVEQHRRRLEGAVTVLRQLPADGTTLAALASDVLGDPHALDRGRSVATLVIDALTSADRNGAPRDAESIRSAWERAGVAPDVLSSTTLVIGLRPSPDHPLHPYLRAAADVSEPVVLTLGQLRRWPLPPLAGESVAFVVENPSVIAEAAHQGWADGPVLMCSSGRPTVAVVTMVRQLAAAGAAIYQHADFDEAGIAITSWLTERAATHPWLMDTASYRAAIANGARQVTTLGSVPPTPWDPPLADLMTATGRPIYEEALRADLLENMRAVARAR